VLYIVEICVMAFPEIGELVERARDSGDEVAVCGESRTVTQAMEEFQQLVKAANVSEAEDVHVIANNGAYFAAALIIGADFTWALDIY